MKILFAVLRTILAYLVLLIITRIMGRKSISQMTTFNFVISITIGAVAGNLCTGNDNTTTTGAAVLFTFGCLEIITGFAHIKSFRIRKLINSEPLVIIENGEIIKKNMQKARLTLDGLTSLLREKTFYNIADVNYAIMENSGELSVLPKADKKPLTPSDMQQNPPETGLTRELIIDGNIMYENLKQTNLTEQWLYQEISNKGIHTAKDVFFAAVDSTGKLYISLGNKRQEIPGEHGIE